MDKWVKDWTEDIDFDGVCYLVYATVDTMYSDYVSCENEIERIKAGHKAITTKEMLSHELSLFQDVGLRTVDRITGKKNENLKSLKWLINENLDIYLEELEAEKREILDYFQGHIFTAILPDLDPKKSQKLFLENAESIRAKRKKRGYREKNNNNSIDANSRASYGRPRKFLCRRSADER